MHHLALHKRCQPYCQGGAETLAPSDRDSVVYLVGFLGHREVTPSPHFPSHFILMLEMLTVSSKETQSRNIYPNSFYTSTVGWRLLASLRLLLICKYACYAPGSYQLTPNLQLIPQQGLTVWGTRQGHELEGCLIAGNQVVPKEVEN